MFAADRLPAPEARLRQAGLRVTAPRLAVLEALAGSAHLDADEVAAQVRQRLGSVSRQTVYDALRVLTHRGLVRQIQPAGFNRLFETRAGDNHHHAVCRQCARVEDVDCAVGVAPCLDPVQNHGFLIDQAEVTYWGVCPACQAATGSRGVELEPRQRVST